MKSMTGFGKAAGVLPDGTEVSVVVKGVNHRFLDVGDQAPRRVRLGRARDPEGRREDRSEGSRRRPHADDKGGGRARHLAHRHGCRGEICEGMERRFFEKGIAGGSLRERPPRAAGRRARRTTPAPGRRFHLRRNPRLSRRSSAAGFRRGAGARRGRSFSHLQRNLPEDRTRVAARLDAERVGISDRIQRSLRERIEKLAAGIPLDEGRLAQEVAQLADRADITEEIDRLKAHLAEARRLLASGGAGRTPSRPSRAGAAPRGEHVGREGPRGRARRSSSST